MSIEEKFGNDLFKNGTNPILISKIVQNFKIKMIVFQLKPNCSIV